MMLSFLARAALALVPSCAPQAGQTPAQPQSPPASAAAEAPATFEQRFQVAKNALTTAKEAQAKTFAEGDFEAWFTAMRAAVPEREKDAAQALAYAEALGALLPAEAQAAASKAFELAPKERATMIARGRALHAQGKFAEATALYKQAAELSPSPVPPMTNELHGLRAASLLDAGSVDEAAREWQQAGALQLLGDLERDLRWIHAKATPERKRIELLKKIQAGDDTLIEELIVTDCFYDGNGDYANSNRAWLTKDMTLAQTRLGKDSRRYLELEYFATSRMRIEPNSAKDVHDDPPQTESMALPPSNIERGGRRMGFVGSKKNKHFPISSSTAPLIYRMLFMDGVTISVEWLDLFGEEMLARATSEAGDVNMALLLLDLQREAIDRKFPTWETMPEKRELYEKEFWKRYKDPRIAWRLLDRRSKELTSEDPVLVEALGLFPGDVKLASLSLECAKKEKKPLREPLVRVAKAALAEANLKVASDALIGLSREAGH